MFFDIFRLILKINLARKKKRAKKLYEFFPKF